MPGNITFSTNSEFERNYKVLQEQLTKSGYESSSMEKKNQSYDD